MNTLRDFHGIPDYQNPDVMAISRLPAHTRWGAFASEAEALRGDIAASSNVLDLNGTWQFKLYDRPEEVQPFWSPADDVGDFTLIRVPGNWELQGHDHPVYTNTIYPWEDPEEPCYVAPHKGGKKEPNPPYIPGRNPTGCYRRVFPLPAHFAGKRLVLRFEGAETAYYVWLNGRCVGFAKDSKLPSEFDATEAAIPGENLLCVQVMHFADSSYMEDQDYWYLSGIYRSVMLIAKPPLAIEDYQIIATPDLARGSGTVRCDVRVTRAEGFADCRVRMKLFDADRKLLASGEGEISAAAVYRQDVIPSANTGRVRLSLDRAALWSPEEPNLYRAVVELIGPGGETLDCEACDIGFREIKVVDGVVHLNGKRLLIFGVNRHDFCWEGGRTVSKAHMLEEIRQMKRMNINAVRTCHYPDTPDWYELCDRYGILLVCECNLETHGMEGALAHNPAWATNFLDRVVRMVCNYKNHAAIYAWSLGNESGTGPNHAAMYGFVKEYDPTRLCQYEAGAPGKNISDIRGNMYAPIEMILGMLADPRDDRPIILVEYLYQISNSGGGMYKFNELLDRFPRFQGGYIWDWQDKSLVGRTEDGKKFFAYGGDFGETMRNNGPLFMTNNGLVMPDLRWKPVAHEVKEGYCPLRIAPAPRGFQPQGVKALVINHDLTRTAASYRLLGQVLEDGVPICEQEIALPPLGPLERAAVDVTVPHEKKPGRRYDLNLEIRRREATFFSEADAVVGLTQLPLESGGAVLPVMKPVQPAPCEIREAEGRLTVTAGETLAEFDPQGHLTLLKKAGKKFLDGAVQACLNRPITGMDCWGEDRRFRAVREMKERFIGRRIDRLADGVRVETLYGFEGNHSGSVRLVYTISAEGVEAEAFFEVDPALRALLRVGIEAVIPAGFEKVTYLGNGPIENYCDRKLCAPFGRYTATVDEMHFDFNPPSENGGHEGTRRIELANGEGAKLIFAMRQDAHFDIRHATIADYAAARHEHELPRRPESWLHLDAAHAPIGGDMGWSTGVDQREMLRGGAFALRFGIRMEA